MRVSAAVVLLFLAGQVSAQTAVVMPTDYRLGIFPRAQSATPAATDKPLAELTIPLASFTCGQPQVPAPTAPIVIGLTPGPWFLVVDDPSDAASPPTKTCKSADLSVALTQAAAGKLPACTSAPCPLYPVFASAISSASVPQTKGWSSVGAPFFTLPSPPPDVPTQVRVSRS